MQDDPNQSALNPEQEFWADPHDESKFTHAPKGWRNACLPDFYLDMDAASKYYVERLLQHAPLDSYILELGANCGRNLHFFRKAGYKNVCGIELNKEAIRNAFEHYPDVAGFIAQGTIQKLLPIWEQVDVIFTSVTLMHIPWFDDWILNEIADKARKIIMVTEIEDSSSPIGLKFARNYKTEFEALGWKQIEHKHHTGVAKIARCTLRIFHPE